MEQLPADILGTVLDRLDPYSLAAAACASKQWQEEAYKEHRWQPFVLAVMGTAAASGQQGSWRKVFFQAAAGMAYLAIWQHFVQSSVATAAPIACQEVLAALASLLGAGGPSRMAYFRTSRHEHSCFEFLPSVMDVLGIDALLAHTKHAFVHA